MSNTLLLTLRYTLIMSLPETVEAITVEKPGGLEVLQKTTLPFPVQKPDEVLVKVCSAVKLN